VIFGREFSLSTLTFHFFIYSCIHFFIYTLLLLLLFTRIYLSTHELAGPVTALVHVNFA